MLTLALRFVTGKMAWIAVFVVLGLIVYWRIRRSGYTDAMTTVNAAKMEAVNEARKIEQSVRSDGISGIRNWLRERAIDYDAEQ